MRSLGWFRLSRYGWTFWLPLLLAGLILTATLAGIWAPLGWACALLTVAGLAFFRDPPRRVPPGPGAMLAPADGEIKEVSRVERDEIFGGPALRISIFLSLLDVHVNRSPCNATIGRMVYQPGEFFDARRTEAAVRNEANTIWLLPPAAPANVRPIAVVRQVAGAVARRIVAPLKPGQALQSGEPFGMIAFGSRTELLVPRPEVWQVLVRVGQHVQAGQTVLLRWRG